jgi:hypothetical protein
VAATFSEGHLWPLYLNSLIHHSYFSLCTTLTKLKIIFNSLHLNSFMTVFHVPTRVPEWSRYIH